MFWNKKNHRHITLKTRMALSYALLFFISCSLIFWLMVYLITAMLNRAGETNTRLIASEVELLYITGPRVDRFGEIRPGSDYPADEKAVLNQRFPGVEVYYVYRTVSYSGDHVRRVYHTAFACYRGDFYEMRVQNGRLVYSRKIDVSNHLGHLRRYFTQQLYARGQDNFFIGIYNIDDSAFLTSDMLDEWIEDTEAKPASAASDPARELTGQKIRKNFIFTNFTLPDGRKLVIGRSEKPQEQILTRYALLFFGLLAVITLIGICVGWLISLRFIRGIRRTTLAMNRISSGDYSYRIEDIADGDLEIRELMETFNAMNARTEELLKELKTISDDVAHDLRTPLTRISGTVELLLRDRELSEPVRSACASAAEEIARMRELINVMMEITRTNSNPKEINKIEIDLVGLLRNFCEIMQPAFEEKNLELRFDLPESPIPILADKTKFQRVISNLLENALKFTEKGQVEVSVKQLPGSIRIEIADTGCGISERDQKHVFERFFQGDASRNLPGNGLGLALVQAVVKAHGWQITLLSAPGRGTTFTIIIPAGLG